MKPGCKLEGVRGAVCRSDSRACETCTADAPPASEAFVKANARLLEYAQARASRSNLSPSHEKKRR